MSDGISDFNRKKLKRVEDTLRGDVPELSARPGYEISDGEDKQEYFDDPDEVIKKVKQLALYIKNAKHMVAYTGAGITTSANVPDYRSPNGVWEVMSRGERLNGGASLSKISPTPAHMALAKLTHEGILKFTVTTNVDCLHIRSGMSPHSLSELHGNVFKKCCPKCKKYYYQLPEMKKDKSLEKVFKNICPICSSLLERTGVGFGSNLPQDEWNKAKNASETCDLALVLGTSMRVAPACNLPEKSYKNKGNLVICNLQKTPYDKYASLVIHAKTDQVMELLCKELNITIPSPPSGLYLDPVDF